MPLPLMLYVDTELHVIHTDRGCQGAAIPDKYHYLRLVYVTTPDEAKTLDKENRPCDKCKRLELEAKASSKKPYRRRGWSA